MKLIFTLGLILILATPAHAASEFTTNFNSLYTIKNTGETSVSHTITLKNNLAHIYATSYTIATGGDNLGALAASDESGPIDAVTTTQNGNTTIQLSIINPKIGKDQVKTLNLSYTTDDVVETIGDSITINIPRLARANEAAEYTRTVRIEGQQDRDSLIYPLPNKTEPDGEYTVYTFEGHANDSLTMLFGKSVTYKLNLTYELKNKDMNPIDSELALPPDTSYQHILLENISPPPQNIRLDNEGNWLARYNLKAGEKLLIKAELYATVYPKPTLYDPSTTTLVKTAHSKYWDPTAPSIVDLSAKLKTPENIYNYLTTTLSYNYAGISSGGGRLGTLKALASPTSVLCTEFTDVFVSLVRARGIPAREINGYGYTKNRSLQPQNIGTDILHSWPEYYDETQKTWVSVDPTWGHTTGGVNYFSKLDFSHLTFVRHGQEDSYPLPAGAYKSNPLDKYIQVDVAESLPDSRTTSVIRDGVIYNTGNVALINAEVGYLPPYGSYKQPSPKSLSLYDKIRAICAKLLSKF
jgi:transglutaminase-like putative cysteine protease